MEEYLIEQMYRFIGQLYVENKLLKETIEGMEKESAEEQGE